MAAGLPGSTVKIGGKHQDTVPLPISEDLADFGQEESVCSRRR